ncbi:MAG: chemotaxis protein CheD [Cytophagales bacterium]|nr:chemotaxis protein CheD [Cytophagales bacterium]
MPSTFFVHKTAHEIQTVLGSCVAVCLYDVKKQFGGMNHFMLPVWNDQGLATPKYGNIATNRLIDKMISLGSEKKDLVAKVFGGANGLVQNSVYEIGKRNITVAYEILERNHIPILKSDTGGVRGRKILMNTATNKILLKYV